MKKILSTVITFPLKGRLGGVLFALLATTALWAEQFEANGLRYTITSESTVEVAGYDWYDQVLTIPSEVTGPVVKNEVHPELPNPGAGKITICVQVAQPFCEGVSIVIPGTITSWEAGDATANGQVIEKVDNTESWYAGTFDWNTDEQSELPRFKIAHTLTDGTWYWDYQAYNLEFVQGNAWRDYEGGDIYIGADDQVIYIRVLDWNTTSCLDDSKVETTTYQVTGVAPWAFSGIPNSSSAVMIPNSISYIGEGAFSGFNGNVVLEATTPPNNIAAFNTEASICVPCAALEAYQQHDEWSYLNLKGLNYNLNVAADHGGGYVRVTSSDCETGNATIETFASYDYISFSQWSDGSTENPRTLSLTQDTTIIAQYIEKPSYNVTLQGFNLQASYCEGYTDCQDYYGEYIQFTVHEGTVITLQDNTSDYASFSEWSDGVTENPRTITITQDTIIESKYVEKTTYNVTLQGFSLYASWNDRWGYQESWNNHIQFSVYEGSQVNFSEQSGCGEWLGWSDGVMDNERTITITSDTTITSRLNVETYSVKVTAESGGYIEGGDIETERNECDSWLWICAQPWDGYYFKGWSNGNQNSCTDIYMNQDTTLVAYFAEMKAVNLDVRVADGCADMGRVEGGGQYFTGDRVMISAIPNEGYHFMEWSDGGLSLEREIFLTSDTTLTASFALGEIGGKCGKNLTWSYDPLTTTLTITGSGDMYNGMQQWHDQYSSEITTINLPNTMTSIGEYAFEDCYALTSVIIPNSVTSIGESAFQATSLTSIVVPENVTHIGRYAFADVEALKTVEIGSGVKELNATFVECLSLESVILSEGLETIGENTFCACPSLATINIPNSVTSIGEYAFADCYALTSITIPSSVTSIEGESVFAGCIFVKENFINNSSLDAQANNYWGATIVDSETDGLIIRNDTVIGCRPNVISANIPANVTAIGESAFYYCTSLTSVTIPNSVTSIGDYAFSGAALKSIVVPDNVTYIGRAAFADMEETLKSAVIGSGVKELNATFVECMSLESVILSEGLETIGDEVFNGCNSLNSVNIPHSVTSIGYAAFAGCLPLESVVIPSSVTSIGDWAFNYCTSLSSVTCLAITPSAMGEWVFDGCDNPTLFVLCNALSDYQEHEQWGQFANIECIGSEEVETEEVVIESGTTTISITWPTEESANTYTIVVKKADEVVCTLIFNAEGQLINAAFAPGRNGNRPAQYAEQVADGSGFRFTVTGLEEGTDYTYEVVTKDEEDNTLSTYSGEFTTQRNIATDVENTDAQYPTSDIQKIMHNGQLLILRDGKTYNVMGAEIQ